MKYLVDLAKPRDVAKPRIHMEGTGYEQEFEYPEKESD